MHIHFVVAEEVVNVTLGDTMLEDSVRCEDPCEAPMRITDFVDVKDPDDVSLTRKADNSREAGAYTVDALYHAMENSATDKEV